MPQNCIRSGKKLQNVRHVYNVSKFRGTFSIFPNKMKYELHYEYKFVLRSLYTIYCLIEVVTKAGLTVHYWFWRLWYFKFSKCPPSHILDTRDPINTEDFICIYLYLHIIIILYKKYHNISLLFFKESL